MRIETTPYEIKSEHRKARGVRLPSITRSTHPTDYVILSKRRRSPPFHFLATATFHFFVNLLSHALLSRSENDDVLTVNVLWDFLGKELRRDPRPFVRRGAAIHKTIDRETDTSDEFKRALNLVSSARNRVSSVVVDIAFDYALSQDWEYYSDEDRLALYEHLYDRMEGAAPSISARAVELVARMRQRNWFKAYGDPHGIHRVFLGIASQRPCLALLAGAETEVIRNAASYTQLMRSLYPKIDFSLSNLR